MSYRRMIAINLCAQKHSINKSVTRVAKECCLEPQLPLQVSATPPHHHSRRSSLLLHEKRGHADSRNRINLEFTTKS